MEIKVDVLLTGKHILLCCHPSILLLWVYTLARALSRFFPPTPEMVNYALLPGAVRKGPHRQHGATEWVCVLTGARSCAKASNELYPNLRPLSTEVEVDVLTGEHVIRRTDIFFDCGRSLNPMIDMGQVGPPLQAVAIPSSQVLNWWHPARMTLPRSWDPRKPLLRDHGNEFTSCG